MLEFFISAVSFVGRVLNLLFQLLRKRKFGKQFIGHKRCLKSPYALEVRSHNQVGEAEHLLEKVVISGLHYLHDPRWRQSMVADIRVYRGLLALSAELDRLNADIPDRRMWPTLLSVINGLSQQYLHA